MMPVEPLKAAAYCAYLAAWLVIAVTAIVNAIPKTGAASAPSPNTSASVLLGTLLQAISALPITLALPDRPLNPNRFELAAALVLAPLGATLFLWAVRSAPRRPGPATLVTHGPYRLLRHPIYLAFLALILATGLLASAALPLAAALALYLTGAELRIAAEESELTEKFPAAYPSYRHRTRWRYLPGLR